MDARACHKSSAGREDRIDRSETAKIFACKAGSYKSKNPWERALRAKRSSAKLPCSSGGRMASQAEKFLAGRSRFRFTHVQPADAGIREEHGLMSNVIAMPRLVIRPGTDADRDAVVAMVSEIWAETYAGHLSPGPPARPDVGHIPDLVGNPAEQGWVATLGARLVGYGSVTANCVDQIWISAGMRRRGIGSALLARAIEGIRERGFAFAQAGCEDFNRPARQFLEAKGWRVIDSQAQTLGGGRNCNALVFSKPLM